MAKSHHLIGRERELKTLRAWLDEDGVALVTICGIAGVGKTSLALAYLAEVRDGIDEADGVDRAVHVCDASRCADADELCARLAAELGVSDAAARDDVTEQLMARLAVAPLLLLLDNLEAIAGACAPIIEGWLDAVPELMIVVTSRERLGLSSERLLELQPLHVDDEVAHIEKCDAALLFVERVREHSADFAVHRRDRATLAELLAGLDGLPLAIELAAARASVLSIADLAQRMRDRFALLRRSRSHHKAPRHASLRGVLEESWQQLSDAERRALARCSVFRGGFCAPAAEFVIDASDEGPAALDLLQALRDRYLIGRMRGAAPSLQRLALLQSVSDFAAERSDDAQCLEGQCLEGQRLAAEARHAEWYADFATRLPDELDASLEATFEQVMIERDNLFAAIDRSAASDDPLRASQGLHIALAIAPVDSITRGRGAVAARLAALANGDHAEQLEPAARSHALTFAAVHQLRRIDTSQPDPTALAERALRVATSTGDGFAIASAARLMALTASNQGDVQGAIEVIERHLKEPAIAHDVRAQGTLLDELAGLLRQLGRQAEARRHAERALEIFSAGSDIVWRLNVLATLTFIHIEQADLELANLRASRGLELLAALDGNQSRVRQAFELAKGRIEHAAGNLDEAVTHYESALGAALALGMPVMHAYAAASLGMALAEMGALAPASERLREALTTISLVDVPYAVVFQAILAAVEAQRGHLEEAERLFAEARSAPMASGPLGDAIEACRGLLDQGRVRHGRDAAQADALTESVSQRLADLEAQIASAPTQLVLELRLISRLLRARGIDAQNQGPDAPRLTVDEEGRWFEPPRGARIACHRRPIMRRMLVALVQKRIREPGRALGMAELLDAGWPGERILPNAAKRRLQVMLSRMRDLGLRGVLQTTDEGYRIDPECMVRMQTT